MSLPILDVAIGLSFIYLLLALICTSVNEMLAGVTNKRGKYLELGITRLLNDDVELKDAIYKHPLVRGITKDAASKLPAYISPKRFAAALLDHITGADGSRAKPEDVRQAIDNLNNSELRKSLRALIPEEVIDVDKAHEAIEGWFNEGMDRVSGWYKRNAQMYAFILAAIVTLALNADSLNMARVLWVNPTLRAQLVDEAKSRSERDRPEEMLPLVEYRNPDDPTKGEATVFGRAGLSDREVHLLTQVMGWDDNVPPKNPFGWIARILGWLMTMSAVSLGAPFWFDTLNRFMNIRNAGRSPNEARGKTAAEPLVKGQ
jgi:hypothetical protein